MITSLYGKHLVTLQDWTKQELDTALETAFDLKLKAARRIPHATLRDQTVYMMFFGSSTRTRCSCVAAANQLGAHAHYIDAVGMQSKHGDTPKDTATILSSYGHCIACRNCAWEEGNDFIAEMAKWSRVPVINLQSDLYHPLQAIADLMTIQEYFGRVPQKRLKVSIIWCYATTHKKPISVPVSQVLLFPRYGYDVTLAYPEGYELPDWVIALAEENAKKNGGTLTITHDQDAAYRDADVVFPKNWGSWVADTGKEADVDRSEEACALSDEELAILAQNKSWKCTQERFDLTAPNGVYMHALPADHENEVDFSVIDGPRSVIYPQAENRLHTIKAIMDLTMGGRS